MSILSEEARHLISQFKFAKKQSGPREGVSLIQVDEVAKKVAAFYERIRTIVDWKEEHLMKRSAIIRKLKRKFFDLELNNFESTENVAETFVLELIRGGHFPNNKIEESKIGEVQKIIEKYIFILKNNPENKQGKAGINFYNWLLEVASCEIEEVLSEPTKELALIEFMYDSMKEKIKISDKFFEAGIIKKEEVNIQIYIATCLALFKFDQPMLSYSLIKFKYPGWSRCEEDVVNSISQNAFKIWQEIQKDLNHPLGSKFHAICEKYDTPYLLIGDILLSNEIEKAEEKITNPVELESAVKEVYLSRLKTSKKRISRAAIYSTISIFVTKIFTLILLEVLIVKATGHAISVPLLLADILIPTILMFLIINNIKKPSKNNLNVVTMETMKIIHQADEKRIFEIKMPRKKGFGVKFVLSLVYVISTFVTFGAIFYVMRYFGFSLLSIFIDIIFIALILFAGTAISKRAQELNMEQEKEGFIIFLADIFSLPIQGLGKFLSNKWKKYNFFTSFFNALIDMPFSAFVEFLERWRYFIKEKKEEIR